MAAGKDSIQGQRVNVSLEIPTIHLNRKFIPENQRDGECVVLIVIGPVALSGKHDLLQAYKIFIPRGISVTRWRGDDRRQ